MIKLLLHALTIAGIAGGGWGIYRSRQPVDLAPRPAELTFQGFAPGAPTPVRFDFDHWTFTDLTPLDRVQQMRDWTLYTIVAQAGLSGADLRQVLVDLPPARLPHTQPAAGLEWGETRSRAINAGGGAADVIALVPAGPPGIVSDHLAHIADRERKTLGEIPRRFHVFEYTLDSGAGQAQVTYRGSRPGDELYSARFGFFEQRIDSAESFRQFMGKIDAVTGARLDVDRVVLSGRRIEHLGYRGIGVEEVAALWQSERRLQAVEAEVDDFQARWRNRTYRYEWEREALEKQFKEESALLKAKLGAGGSGRGLATSSGFSLDPVFKHSELKQRFPIMRLLIERVGVATAEELDAAARALDENDESPLLEALYKLSTTDDPRARFLAELLEEVTTAARFQHARYDGLLQGTEVGMVLFYTDLLAKLWALDYLGSAPGDGQVAGFVPLLKVQASPIYQAEMRARSSTRLWFGPQEDGYQKQTQGNGILFARNGTRVYAASSNPLKPGQEAEPNVESEAFLGWWNNNYETVARYEREYERLNEIMKWSLLVGWLATEGKFDKLAFLRDVPVTRTHWFPDWARRNTNLRFNKWSQAKFLPRGFGGVDTEALEILYSETYEGGGLSGGVSLGSRKLVAERSVLDMTVDPALRRSNFRYSVANRGKQVFERYDGTSYDLSAAVRGGEAAVTVRARPNAKFRSLQSEIRNAAVETRFAGRQGVFHAHVKIGGRDLVDLSINRGPDGFLVRARGREVAQQNAIRRLMDRAARDGREAGLALAEDPAIEAAAKLPGDAGYLVKVRGPGEQWLLIQKESTPAVDLPAGTDLRWAAGSGERLVRWNGKAVTPQSAAVLLKSGRYLNIEQSPAGSRPGVFMEVTNRGPPAGAATVDYPLGGTRVRAFKPAGESSVWVEQTSLPGSVRSDPRQLARPPTDTADFALAGFSDQPNLALGRRLAADPKGFKQQVETARKRLLERIDHWERDGHPEMVLREVDSVPESVASSPELRLRRGIAEIKAGDSGRGRRTINDWVESAGGDQQRFDQRIAGLVALGEKAGDVKTCAQAGDLNYHLARGATVKGSARVVPQPGGLAIEVQLLQAPLVSAEAGTLKGARYLYLEESPRLGNLDPVATVIPSVDQIMGRADTVSKLVSWEIAQTKPEFLVHTPTGARYRRIDFDGQSRAPKLAGFGGGGRPPTSNVPLSHNPCAPGDARDREPGNPPPGPGCDDQIYLVRLSPPQQAAAGLPR